MKKNIIVYILLIFLIVVNGFFLFNYMGKNRMQSSKAPQENRDFLVKELGFTSAQLAAFNPKNEAHHALMKRLSDDIRNLKDELYNKLSDAHVEASTIDSLAVLISEKESEKEKEIFYHFKMIQELSNDKQKEKFKRIIMDALRQGDQGQGPPPREGQGHRPPPPERN